MHNPSEMHQNNDISNDRGTVSSADDIPDDPSHNVGPHHSFPSLTVHKPPTCREIKYVFPHADYHAVRPADIVEESQVNQSSSAGEESLVSDVLNIARIEYRSS